MTVTIKHQNKSPCGFICPERDLPGCRKTCEKWQAYERERLEASAKRSYGDSTWTAGSELRSRKSAKYRQDKEAGRL